jgi:hypothetical protein
MSGGDQGEDVWVIMSQSADAVGEPLQIGLPSAGGFELLVVGAQVQLVDHVVDDAFEEVLAAVDVAVERHGFDPEFVAEPAHGQCAQAALVDEGDRGVDDAFARQGLAARCGGPRRAGYRRARRGRVPVRRSCPAPPVARGHLPIRACDPLGGGNHGFVTGRRRGYRGSSADGVWNHTYEVTLTW